jgi:hypothetical protein
MSVVSLVQSWSLSLPTCKRRHSAGLLMKSRPYTPYRLLFLSRNIPPVNDLGEAEMVRVPHGLHLCILSQIVSRPGLTPFLYQLSELKSDRFGRSGFAAAERYGHAGDDHILKRQLKVHILAGH